MANLPSYNNGSWYPLPRLNNGPGGNGLPSYSYMPSGDGGADLSGGVGGGGNPFDVASLAGGIPAVAGSAVSAIAQGLMQQTMQKRAIAAGQQQQQGSLSAGQATNVQGLAADESNRDPFRSRMAQLADLGKTDRVANATVSPVSVQAPARVSSGAAPQVSGGYSYTKSPALTSSARAIQQSVMSGNQDPSMTNPGNYGKTGALDLLGVAAGTKDPTQTSAFATGAPLSGSATGGDPVSASIQSAFQKYLGRPATEQDLQTTIGNLQRWKSGPLTTGDIAAWAADSLAGAPEARTYAQKSAPAPSYMQAA